MQIIATSHRGPFRQSKVLAPNTSEHVPAADAKELLKAAGTFALKNVTATGVGGMAWKLTTVPQTTSHQELATLLANNNIAPDKAPLIAHELRELLGNPALRSLLIGVSGGAMAYLVVEKTSWSQRTKWLTIIGVGIACSLLYLALRHYGIMN